jgi:hypothetical protein
MSDNQEQNAREKCAGCNGRGTAADYVGLEMRCIEVECPWCKGIGSAAQHPSVAEASAPDIAASNQRQSDFMRNTPDNYGGPPCDATYDTFPPNPFIEASAPEEAKPTVQLHDRCDRCGDNRLQHASKFPYDHKPEEPQEERKQPTPQQEKVQEEIVLPPLDEAYEKQSNFMKVFPTSLASELKCRERQLLSALSTIKQQAEQIAELERDFQTSCADTMREQQNGLRMRDEGNAKIIALNAALAAEKAAHEVTRKALEQPTSEQFEEWWDKGIIIDGQWNSYRNACQIAWNAAKGSKQ